MRSKNPVSVCLVPSLVLSLVASQAPGAAISHFDFNGPPWTAAKEADFATFSANTPSVDADANSVTSTLINSGHTGGGYLSFYIRDADGFSIFSTTDGVGGNFGNSNATVPTNYIGFSVTPDTGFQITFESLTFFSGVNGTNDDYNIQLRSFDGATETTLGTYSRTSPASPSNSPVVAGSIDFADFTASSATEFRLYLYGVTGGGANGGVRLDDVILNGETTAIPEPSNFLISLLGLGFLGVRRRAQ